MRQAIKAACGVAALAAVAVSAPVLADKGLGDYYNQKYEAYGISSTHVSIDGAVAVDVQDIETVNCGGCDTQWYGPGLIFHLRNLTKEPVCAAFVFDRSDQGDYSLDYWGSGTVYYLKGRKSLSKIGGIYMISTGEERSVNLGYSYAVHTWTPIAKNKCGTDPYA